MVSSTNQYRLDGGPMPRPPGHGQGFEVRRQEIIDRAADLFARRGYAATGIAEIATAVGLAKGALYYYIGSKEQLLLEIQSRVLRPLLTRARQIARLDADPVLRLRLLSEAMLTIVMLRLNHVWVYEHDYRHLTGTNLAVLLRQRGEFERIVANLLSEAMDEGTFREMNIRLATFQFLNMHNHTYQWVNPDGEWGAAHLSREYCATLFRGFGHDSGDLRSVENRVERFLRENPGLSLNPEQGWRADVLGPGTGVSGPHHAVQPPSTTRVDPVT
jgi:TetR/AcrR family transcriptional regulator, cholesterol catabolism regulator